MSYIYYNANPCKMLVGDCVIRAVSFATGRSWRETYTGLCASGLEQCDMPNSNAIWDQYLRDHGFYKDVCPECFTVREFCDEHPEGVYVLATGTHAVACAHGDYYDIFDSGSEVVSYFFELGEFR